MQLRQGKVEAYREQQEHHAELGERLEFRHGDRRPGGVRAEDHADQQISQAGRYVQALEYKDNGYRHSQQQDDLCEMFHPGFDQGLNSTSQPAW